MADEADDSEKTEDPTRKRLDDAIKKGDVPKSQEVTTWFVLAGATLTLAMFSGGIVDRANDDMRGFLNHLHDIPMDPAGLRALLARFSVIFFTAIAIPLSIIAIFAIVGHVVQHPFVFSAEQMKPKLSKISPISGTKRLFSMESLVNFAKGIAKLVVVSVILALVLWPDRDTLDTMIDLDITAVLSYMRIEALKLFAATLFVMTIIAALDYAYQQQKWQKKQRMTQREVKEEYKQTEGDPQIKARIRAIRTERARKRMMQNVPDASVVITNPTHFAVALKYEMGMEAPVCLAKGTDNIALKIREVAEQHNIPVVENPPLARALFASVEIDQMIPEEHFRAVANVIGYVMRMKQNRRWTG